MMNPAPQLRTIKSLATQQKINGFRLLKFCKQGKKNENIEEIINAIQSEYGFYLPQRARAVSGAMGRGTAILPSPWTWADLIGPGRGGWLVARALSQRYGYPGEDSVRRTFGQVQVITTAGGNFPGAGGPLAALAISVGGAAAVVPPPGIGGDGRTIYIKDGLSDPADTFIHEMGHTLDFKFGTRYDVPPEMIPGLRYGTPSGSSESLLRATGGSYDPNAGCYRYINDGVAWGECIASNGRYPLGTPDVYTIGYNVGGKTTPYGQTNHFEDFAESWRIWVEVNSVAFHDGDAQMLKQSIDDTRYNFFDVNVARWVRS